MKAGAQIRSAGAILAIALLAGCAHTQLATDVAASAAQLRAFADSLKGMNWEAVRQRLAGANFEEDTWRHDGLEGRVLNATFPTHKVSVYFSSSYGALVTNIVIQSD